MARLNVICNGMMIFNETADQHVQIVVPPVDGHVRKFCSDPQPALNNLAPLNTGSFQLSGPASGAATLLSLIPPDRYLVLKKSVAVVDLAAAATVSAIIKIPMPPLVRLFRASEPTGSVFGNSPLTVAHARPRIHHDVVVFSYPNLAAGTHLAIQPQSGQPLASATTVGDEIINWIFYSTEAVPIPGGGSGHPTASLNVLVRVNSLPLDFSLSAIGPKDGFHSTGIGMTQRHMAAFHELPPTPMGQPIDLNSGDSGCSGMAVG